MTDPTAAVWDILHPGKPLPPKPVDLPTAAGLYVVDQPHHHNTPDWWVDSAVFRRTRSGYWLVDEYPATVDEVAAIVGSNHLVPLIPKTEADL